MTEKIKLYHCGLKITALIKAWLWRRESRETTIGKMMTIENNKDTHIGYFVTGVKW